MIIHHFAKAQTDVFVPALAVLAVAALFAVLPVIFAPTLRRRSGGRALTVASVVVAAAALVLTAVQAGAGFRVLGDERADVRAAIARDYGLHLDAAQVGVLVDGGGVPKIRDYGDTGIRFKLVGTSTDTYRLVVGKGRSAVALPSSGQA